MICGDLHGNAYHLLYVGQCALDEGAEAIMAVGDFGFWEHTEGGVAFLDVCSDVAMQNNLPIYWIDGNHENHTLLRSTYGPGGPKHELTPEGFWVIRPGVYYIPRGTRWNWNGVEMMGLGGAYSVDKSYRLARERGVACHEWGWTWEEAKKHPATGPLTMWWPEEEISDEELAYALSDDRPIDVLFTHDKPRASNPRWNRKDLPDCYPNQDRIQEVVKKLHPAVVLHGHLHVRYDDEIRADGDHWTKVVGLANDVDPKSERKQHDPRDSWIVLALEKEQ